MAYPKSIPSEPPFDLGEMLILARLAVSSARAGGLGPTLAPATLTGTIYVDPQNTSGVANDANPVSIIPAGQSVAGPVYASWRGVVQTWGTFMPVLKVSTTIIFLSAHTDNSDPVVFMPILTPVPTSAIQAAIQGVLTTVTSGVSFTLNAAKNRAAGTNSDLQGNIGGTGAVGQLVVNTSRSSSRCFPDTSLGGGSFNLTQPLAAQTIGGTIVPAENDAWATNDTVNLLSLTNINIEFFAPLVAVGSSTCELLNVALFAPAGSGSKPCIIGSSVNIRECTRARVVNTITLGSSGGSGPFFINCLGTLGGSAAFAGVNFIGGSDTGWGILGVNPIFDGDCKFKTAPNIRAPFGSLGFVFLGATPVIQTILTTLLNSLYGGSGIIYGSGAFTINVMGSSHFAKTTGTFTNSFTAPGLVTGIQLNGTAAASSHSNANNPDVINSNIATTPTNLDAAQGVAGFGGNAFNLGGGSVSNFQ